MADLMAREDPVTNGLNEAYIEDPERRSQNSISFHKPDGERTTILQGNRHYEARPGEWEPQNLDFCPVGSNQGVTRHCYHTMVMPEGLEISECAGYCLAYLL